MTIVLGGTNPAVTFPDGTIQNTAFGTGPAFSAYRNANQAITASTWTKVQFNTEEFDTANCFDSTTNYRFTPTVAGYYQFTGQVESSGNQAYLYTSIYKNGTEFKRSSTGNNVGTGNTISALIYMNGTTDYVELYVLFASSLNVASGASVGYFQGVLVRSA
jgi:hypothetical protein